jgi:AcrR family transcriptional regulator
MQDRKEGILRQAQQLFNEEGIEYVGMRELAASLGVKVGNLTYYFPTKDDLVNELALELTLSNQLASKPPADMTMLGFLEMHERIFRNQWGYRCLFLSFVHLLRQHAAIRERYRQVERQRVAGVERNLRLLVTGKYLKPGVLEALPVLAAAMAVIARFWISDASVSSFPVAGDPVPHYCGVMAGVLQPYVTAAGHREMREFLETRKK